MRTIVLAATNKAVTFALSLCVQSTSKVCRDAQDIDWGHPPAQKRCDTIFLTTYSMRVWNIHAFCMECPQFSEQLFAATCDSIPQNSVEKCKFSMSRIVHAQPKQHFDGVVSSSLAEPLLEMWKLLRGESSKVCITPLRTWMLSARKLTWSLFSNLIHECWSNTLSYAGVSTTTPLPPTYVCTMHSIYE